MPLDYIILLSVAIVGIADLWTERATGRGILERAIEFCERRKG